ncbi:MAG: hypothetical protein JWR67_3982, partial [Mucilaginibacter sp.]|nr:hypothetical protein [Mucilaginibacter sp.]
MIRKHILKCSCLVVLACILLVACK